MNTHCTMPEHGRADAPSACCRPPITQQPHHQPSAAMAPIWRRAAQNTAVCLLGCTIGDVGMVMASWIWFPHVPMWQVMVAAITAGLITSITLESLWLMHRGHHVRQAISMAFSMSFISMMAMETAMNVVDLGLTGGNRMHLTIPTYIGILALGEIAGFLVALPYNVWRLKHGKACH